MKSVKSLIEEILIDIGIDDKIDLDEISTARIFLDNLNKYFYQKNNNKEYISEYHQYWENNHKEILNPSINDIQAKKIAERFNEVFSNRNDYADILLSPKINRMGLTKNNIANVRFFTAIQDFKIDIYKQGRDPFQQFLTNPEWFDANKVYNNRALILEFLDFLDATGSQGDKRIKWMNDAAKFLIDYCESDAYNIYKLCENDILKVRKLLADEMEIGYSRKKTDMLIRDMLDWKVWKPGKNIEYLNVASDSNTMRIALRTGLLEISIPLLASYLDVYCYQYSLMDEMTQSSWRRVWEIWKELSNNSCPAAPASIDYLLYKSIGKKYCKLNMRKCSECLLDDICPQEKRNLKPPKSISIKGMTGWESGRTDEGGGGGIMS
ncbi:hypothetical protein E9840_05870 [Tissierella creatinini]|nr:hypothetical protein E9840_05870 [Tissierella creatinini]TJX63945.1 hypothetical protein E8P77_13465 [Soehngenia saccharolytica]